MASWMFSCVGGGPMKQSARVQRPRQATLCARVTFFRLFLTGLPVLSRDRTQLRYEDGRVAASANSERTARRRFRDCEIRSSIAGRGTRCAVSINTLAATKCARAVKIPGSGSIECDGRLQILNRVVVKEWGRVRRLYYGRRVELLEWNPDACRDEKVAESARGHRKNSETAIAG